MEAKNLLKRCIELDREYNILLEVSEDRLGMFRTQYAEGIFNDEVFFEATQLNKKAFDLLVKKSKYKLAVIGQITKINDRAQRLALLGTYLNSNMCSKVEEFSSDDLQKGIQALDEVLGNKHA